MKYEYVKLTGSTVIVQRGYYLPLPARAQPFITAELFFTVA